VPITAPFQAGGPQRDFPEGRSRGGYRDGNRIRRETEQCKPSAVGSEGIGCVSAAGDVLESGRGRTGVRGVSILLLRVMADGLGVLICLLAGDSVRFFTALFHSKDSKMNVPQTCPTTVVARGVHGTRTSRSRATKDAPDVASADAEEVGRKERRFPRTDQTISRPRVPRCEILQGRQRPSRAELRVVKQRLAVRVLRGCGEGAGGARVPQVRRVWNDGLRMKPCNHPDCVGAV